jgi:hypothetical protein
MDWNSLRDLGRGHFSIAAIFAGSTATPSFPMTCPKKCSSSVFVKNLENAKRDTTLTKHDSTLATSTLY